MKWRKKTTIGILFALIWLLSGCATSSLVNIWRDSSFKAPPLKKMLVIDVRKNPEKRRIWEDAFSGRLAKHGMEATASYHLFPDAPPDTNQVIEALNTNGFDGVLVILRLPQEKTMQYIPGDTTTEGGPGTRFPDWQRYLGSYQVMHQGYIDTETVDIRTIDVTTTGNWGRIIWSATSRTPNPSDVVDVQKGIVRLVMSELVKHGIVGPKTEK